MMSSSQQIPIPVKVLRGYGRMTTRGVTRLTAERVQAKLSYDDVFAVLQLAEKHGLVACTTHGLSDYRDWTWEAL